MADFSNGLAPRLYLESSRLCDARNAASPRIRCSCTSASLTRSRIYTAEGEKSFALWRCLLNAGKLLHFGERLGVVKLEFSQSQRTTRRWNLDRFSSALISVQSRAAHDSED